MTRYTVVWRQSALDELAEIWLAASDRRRITLAADEIDRELGQDVASKGFDIRDGLQGLIVSPLKAIFIVIEDDRKVEVVRVRLE